MAEPTPLRGRMQRYAESFGNFDRDIILRWADEVALLSRQNEELRKALVAAEKALHPMFARVFNDNHDLTVNTLSFSYGEIVAAYFAYKKIKSALSSAPSPSETEKSGENDGWVRIDAEHPLPDDLTIGDEIELSRGFGRHAITGVEEYGGIHVRWSIYHADGDTWRRSIIAYRRTAGERK
jgi:hypothetical protein